MNDFGRAATIGGVVTTAAAGLVLATIEFGDPATQTAVGFLGAGALLLGAFLFGRRTTVLGAGWAVPAIAGVVILVEPRPTALRTLAALLGMLGVATAIAWPIISRGHALANRFGERAWRR